MAIGSAWFTFKYANTVDIRGILRKAWYLFYTDPSDRDNSDFYSARRGIITYGEYFILLNTLIPISLVVSLEFVKLIQTPFIAHDVKMYDPESMKQA